MRQSRHHGHVAKANDLEPKALRKAGLPLPWRRRTFTSVLLESGSPTHGLVLRRYPTNVCQSCAIKHRCTTAKERRITRWEHEHILEAVQRRLDEHPEKMRQRRETVEHPFGTMKARMGTTHFLVKTLQK